MKKVMSIFLMLLMLAQPGSVSAGRSKQPSFLGSCLSALWNNKASIFGVAVAAGVTYKYIAPFVWNNKKMLAGVAVAGLASKLLVAIKDAINERQIIAQVKTLRRRLEQILTANQDWLQKQTELEQAFEAYEDYFVQAPELYAQTGRYRNALISLTLHNNRFDDSEPGESCQDCKKCHYSEDLIYSVLDVLEGYLLEFKGVAGYRLHLAQDKHRSVNDDKVIKSIEVFQKKLGSITAREIFAKDYNMPSWFKSEESYKRYFNALDYLQGCKQCGSFYLDTRDAVLYGFGHHLVPQKA